MRRLVTRVAWPSWWPRASSRVAWHPLKGARPDGRAPFHIVDADAQMPASSAPQRSQYHSVGRLSVPHSPHLSVLAPPAAPGLPGADGCTAAEPDSEDRPAVWAGPDPGLP